MPHGALIRVGVFISLFSILTIAPGLIAVVVAPGFCFPDHLEIIDIFFSPGIIIILLFNRNVGIGVNNNPVSESLFTYSPTFLYIILVFLPGTFPLPTYSLIL